MTGLFLVALLNLSIPAIAQSDTRVPVDVQYTGEDTVGQQVVYAVKDRVAASTRYRLVTDKLYTSVQLSIVSVAIDNDQDSSALSIQYSASWKCNKTATPSQTHGVRTVGRRRVDDVARAIVAGFAEWIESHSKEACTNMTTVDGKVQFASAPGSLIWTDWDAVLNTRK